LAKAEQPKFIFLAFRTWLNKKGRFKEDSRFKNVYSNLRIVWAQSFIAIF